MSDGGGILGPGPHAPRRSATWRAIERGIQATGEVLARLDAVLARVPYVAGPVFTLADIPLGVHIHRWFFFPVEKPALPHVRAWYAPAAGAAGVPGHVAGPVT